MPAVLVVEADTRIVEYYRSHLEHAGHVVILASSAISGLARLREGGIDVVIADQSVPGGLDALVAGIQRLPDPPPLILTSGTADAPGISARVGAAEFLAKPCAVSELLAAVDRVVPVPAQVLHALEDTPTSPLERRG